MLDWLRSQNWPRADMLALAGVAATIMVASIGPLRRAIGRSARGWLLYARRAERHYSAKFIEKWGQFDNPYLADVEKLDLGNTYVPLSFRAPQAEQDTRTMAVQVLADRDSGNLVIEGAPGSGKSTLLKAYGVGTLKAGRRGFVRSTTRTDIPFFVQLRKFSREFSRDANRPGALADHIRDHILVSQAEMSTADAADFLRYALTEGRALVLLDGLDEVAADRYQAVKEAVHQFSVDRNPDRPTHRARLIVTCRRQNFLALRDEWVPAIASTVCTLAPLRNTEIFSYLDKLRAKFRSPGGPESFFQAVRASGTLDLHRVPLILAMSVGLYARKDYYEIPNSIAQLYSTMIREMLDRQSFKRDPGGGVLAFKVDDKYRFLREFALRVAQQQGGFGDFDRRELAAFAGELAPRLDAVAEPAAFVTEVVDRAGLLSDVSEAGRFVFAHRSIHEHLAAEELRLLAGGGDTLLARVGDPEWRQVVLFYVTAQEQRAADRFLRELLDRDETLAGHCLAGAKASNEVAEAVLDRLIAEDQSHLTALIAATMSPRVAVQEMAVRRLERRLAESADGAAMAFGGDPVDGILPLLTSLAGSNAARIAALVPRIAASIMDDPRLVEPLWRCLAAPGIETQPACRTIVERLLVMAMDADCLAELQRQEPYTRPFLTAELRGRAYPFTRGLATDSNLVTLLTWAEYLELAPQLSNRFFEAKEAGRLHRLEADRRRTIGVCLFWPGRVLSTVTTVGSIAAAAALLVTDWRLLLRPYGWWSLLLLFGAFVLPAMAVMTPVVFESLPPRLRLLASDASTEDLSHVMGVLARWGDALSLTVFFGAGLAYAVATMPLAATSFPLFAIATLGAAILYLPVVDLCARTTRFYPYRPPFVDVYDDSRSRLWVRPPDRSGVAAGIA